ncbi:CRISPR-associated endonuclease Cas2 [Hugenholtzia roseola]|uniref:CRISPR-associated endonuclease Cas2 n=1 Tax=Hugenholtzia roseola TaxID=1002 RepID=UPI0004074091|nr:CRISPR-associated endonuclease Cas2 [Hugenholtzia roseola]
MKNNRLNKYRIMWLFVLFDLPMQTKKERRNYALFRKKILKEGYGQFQFSVYYRHCASREVAEMHLKRLESFLPPKGKISVLTFTDKQFGMIKHFHSAEYEKPPTKTPPQLHMF